MPRPRCPETLLVSRGALHTTMGRVGLEKFKFGIYLIGESLQLAGIVAACSASARAIAMCRAVTRVSSAASSLASPALLSPCSARHHGDAVCLT